jgi:hypothetical protein
MRDSPSFLKEAPQRAAGQVMPVRDQGTGINRHSVALPDEERFQNLFTVQRSRAETQA